ncbi:MAG: hypothetical protein ACD_4C00076G0005 [uncultured bacterium (gcode 4)]|uniref:Uncharacterized protein n=1 Tax=uncultured bacterium (gcode 4) TaxID=1234023 RepID=K2FYR9_9BACT|nr:MAG: hypothetical protein ACD_4C00076G0005 [uncultured bacterium (gcode 4)]
MNLESAHTTQTIDVKHFKESKEWSDKSKRADWKEVSDKLISGYKQSQELQKNLLWLWWDNQDRLMIDALDKEYQSNLKIIAEKHQSNERSTKEKYSKNFAKFWVTYEQFEVEYNKIWNLKYDHSITEKIKNLDNPIETPLLDPLDIILILATFTEIVWKLWLKVLWKWCSLVLNKTWEILIKTEAWTKVLEAKWIWEKLIQRILEKYKDRIQWVKELFEPHWVTSEWIRVKIPKETKGWNFARMEWEEVREWIKNLKDVLPKNFEKLSRQQFQEEFNKKILGNFDDKADILTWEPKNLDWFFKDHSNALWEMVKWFEHNPNEIKNLSSDFVRKLNDYLWWICWFARKHNSWVANILREKSLQIRTLINNN